MVTILIILLIACGAVLALAVLAIFIVLLLDVWGYDWLLHKIEEPILARILLTPLVIGLLLLILLAVVAPSTFKGKDKECTCHAEKVEQVEEE